MAVKKYHLNPITGDPFLCTAKIGNCPYGDSSKHFPTQKEAREAYEGELAKELFKKMKLTKNEITLLKKLNLKDHLRKLDFTAYIARENTYEKFYHSSYLHREIPSVESLHNVYNEFQFSPDKPIGALWLSVGEEQEGKIVNDWDLWNVEGQLRYLEESEISGSYQKRVQEVKLQEWALIIEIDDENYMKIPKIFSDDLPDLLDDDSEEGRNDRSKTVVPWYQLKEFGIDIVRVNGRYNQEHFYGWDVDSIVILSSDSVKELIEVTPETDYKKLGKTFIGNYDY